MLLNVVSCLGKRALMNTCNKHYAFIKAKTFLGQLSNCVIISFKKGTLFHELSYLILIQANDRFLCAVSIKTEFHCRKVA
jgi:hypothetical protein